MARRHENILLKGIHVEADRLPLVESHVVRLMKSIEQVGLLEPIVVCRRTKRSPAIVLVAGRHRLEACKRLKHETIAASVENEESDAVEQWRALAEIDENLIRRDLSAAQRAKLVAKRKGAYETVHPEKKHGAAKGNTGKGRGKAPAIKDADSASFANDTAAKTGKSKRSISSDATRAKKLGDDLDRISGTSLDKGSEMDALAKMPEPARNEIITRAASGEEVSAIKAATAQVPLPHGLVDLKKKVAGNGNPASLPEPEPTESPPDVVPAATEQIEQPETEHIEHIEAASADRGADAPALVPCPTCHGTCVVEIENDDDEPVDTRDPQRGSTPNAAFLLRADEALSWAVFDGKVDERSLNAARSTASAWCRLVEKMALRDTGG